MAEFGEKLKQAREKRGMTQQSLADEIYVTRQAVSRWENGSRYPDLMTARRLSEILKVSLDELIKDDEMLSYPQKSPIAEYPKSKRVQTALFAFCLVPNLISVMSDIAALMFGVFIKKQALTFHLLHTYNISDTVISALLLVLFVYGIVMSVYDKITPKVAGFILGIYFGGRALMHFFRLAVIESYSLRSIVTSGVWRYPDIVLGVVIACVLVWYFKKDTLLKPTLIYCLSGAYCLFNIGVRCAIFLDFLTKHLSLYGERDKGVYFMLRFKMDSLEILVIATMSVLLCYLAREIYKKRRVALGNKQKQW